MRNSKMGRNTISSIQIAGSRCFVIRDWLLCVDSWDVWLDLARKRPEEPGLALNTHLDGCRRPNAHLQLLQLLFSLEPTIDKLDVQKQSQRVGVL